MLAELQSKFLKYTTTNNIKVPCSIHNLTQADLAEKIGVSRQTINAMEKSKYVPPTVLFFKIARLFEKSVEDIFY